MKIFLYAMFCSGICLLTGCNRLAAESGPDAKSNPPNPLFKSWTASIDDTVVTAKLKFKLQESASLNDLDISIETRAGVVTLRGTAANQAQIDLITSMAQNIEKSKGLDNKIVLRNSSGARQEVANKTAVNNALAEKVQSVLQTDLYVDSGKMIVAADSGKLAVSGFASNQAQIDRTIDIVARVDGVKTVMNNLVVENTTGLRSVVAKPGR